MTSTVSPIRTVVVPLDGSALAEHALKIAAVIARQCDARLALIRVHEPPKLAMAHAYDWDAETRRREIEYLSRIATKTREIGDLPIERFVLDGHPSDAICAFAAHRESPLLVMASHGRTGASRLWIGSVTDAVFTRSNVPVLMVRVDEGHASPSVVRRILVALDGSAIAEQILPPAMTIADALGARVDLMRVVDPGDAPPTSRGVAEDGLGAVVGQATSELEDVASSIVDDHPSVPVGVLVHVAESAAATIVDAASAHGCDVVALTTRSSGLRRAILGSVADKVVRAGPALILLVRPRDVVNRLARVRFRESDEAPTGAAAQGSRKSRTDERAVATYSVSQQMDPS